MKKAINLTLLFLSLSNIAMGEELKPVAAYFYGSNECAVTHYRHKMGENFELKLKDTWNPWDREFFEVFESYEDDSISLNDIDGEPLCNGEVIMEAEFSKKSYYCANSLEDKMVVEIDEDDLISKVTVEYDGKTYSCDNLSGPYPRFIPNQHD